MSFDQLPDEGKEAVREFARALARRQARLDATAGVQEHNRTQVHPTKDSGKDDERLNRESQREMTRQAFFSAAELKRMAETANAEGVVVELERDGAILRVMPFKPPRVIASKASREEEAEAALSKWISDQAK